MHFSLANPYHQAITANHPDQQGFSGKILTYFHQNATLYACSYPLADIRTPVEGVYSRLRALDERFNEQIVEDIVYYITDAVDFWVQACGETDNERGGIGEKSPTVLRLVNREAKDVVAAVRRGSWGVEWWCGKMNDKNLSHPL